MDGLKIAVAALNKQKLGQSLANHWLLLLSIDLATFYDVSSITGLHLSPLGGLTSSGVFSSPLPWLPTTTVAPHHYRGSPPPPPNHSYASTCGIDEKLSKMAGNSASYSLKSS